MDFYLLALICSKFLVLIPIFLIILIFKSRWFKGVIGEFLVNSSFRLFLNHNDYYLLKNVTIYTNDSIGTTQIDHVIVSKFGIFVVETKNISGWIFGSQEQSYWTQKLYKITNKFQNPLRQNLRHVKSLQSLLCPLSIDNRIFHSVIVFVGNSKFKNKMPKNVTYGGQCVRYIKSKRSPVLSKNEVQRIVEFIQSSRLVPTFKTHREHIRHINRNRTHRDKNQQYVVCPLCGAKMILRTAKRGKNKGMKFWGCSRYPECKGFISFKKGSE